MRRGFWFVFEFAGFEREKMLLHIFRLEAKAKLKRAGGKTAAAFEQCLCHAQADSARSAGYNCDRLLCGVHTIFFLIAMFFGVRSGLWQNSF